MNAADPSVHLELRCRARRAVLAALLAGGIGACAHGPVQRERPPFPRGALDAMGTDQARTISAAAIPFRAEPADVEGREPVAAT